MMIMRSSVAAALALVLASPVAGQEPTPPTAEPMPMMQHMMSCMHANASAETPAMPMQGMPMMQGTPMMQGMMPGQGMQGMQGAGMGVGAGGANMPMDQCPGCASQDGFAALFGRPAAGLTLTSEQRTEVDAILSRARNEALALLTAEQRTALEARHAAPGGMCMMHGQATPEAQPHN